MKQEEFYYAKDLKKWELIAIADGTSLRIGFYRGRGINGTLQFYSFWSIQHVKNKEIVVEKDLYTSYVSSVCLNRIIKVTHPELVFQDGELERYKQCMDVLIKNNLIK